MGGAYDVLRRKYMEQVGRIRDRNVIAYYSGWLQKPEGGYHQTINDDDKNGFMANIYKLDRTKGLDLILHTPGGGMAPTESLVDYLRTMFDDITAIVPQMAMSAGTMIALSCNQVIMGKHSSLGPIDPQLGWWSVQAILEEFKTIKDEITKDQRSILWWGPILNQYTPTLIGKCAQLSSWAEKMARSWLGDRMFHGDPDKDNKIDTIMNELGSHQTSFDHSRHYSLEACQKLGLKIDPLERDAEIQDAVLAVHHTLIHTLSVTNAAKIITNNLGQAYVRHLPGTNDSRL